MKTLDLELSIVSPEFHQEGNMKTLDLELSIVSPEFHLTGFTLKMT